MDGDAQVGTRCRMVGGLDSLDAFLVVFELHDERLDVFALGLPGGDGALRVRVEILLLLVDERLGLESVGLPLLELPDGLLIL